MIRHLSDGTVFRVKSNALDGLAVGEDKDPETGETFGWSSFSGKATYLEPGWPEPVGNHKFVAYVEDRNEPGSGFGSVLDTGEGQGRDPNPCDVHTRTGSRKCSGAQRRQHRRSPQPGEITPLSDSDVARSNAIALKLSNSCLIRSVRRLNGVLRGKKLTNDRRQDRKHPFKVGLSARGATFGHPSFHLGQPPTRSRRQRYGNYRIRRWSRGNPCHRPPR